MTRKYFQMLAETVADLMETMDLTRDQEEILSGKIEECCERMNPRFKPERFQKAIQKELAHTS